MPAPPTFAVVPVKRFGAAKSRLAGSVPVELRPMLAEAMLGDVLEELGRSRLIDSVVVVTGEPVARRVAAEAGVTIVDDPDDSGHSHAASLGVREAVAAGAGRVALLPGDCPVIDAAEIDAAIEEDDTEAEAAVAVIPDRHGTGTNGLLLRPPDAIGPAFGPGSHARHLELSADAGIAGRTAEVRSLALDLDTPEDLAELSELLACSPGRARRTSAALFELGELRP